MSKLAYIVKYALTSGVQVVDVEERKIRPSCDSDGYWYGKWSDLDGYWYGKWSESHWCGQSFKEGRDFSFDIKEAEKMFEEMKVKKLKSLDKQVKKISGLKFTVKSGE